MLQVDQNGFAHKMEIVESIGQALLVNSFGFAEILNEFFMFE